MMRDNFSMRHVHTLDGLWFYSRVTLKCLCRVIVANPLRAVTVHDDFWCVAHQIMTNPVSVQPATPAERESLCHY